MAERESEEPQYEPPALVDLGTAEDLTESGTFGSGDGVVEQSSVF